ncbi:nuclear protein 96-domain-containing protein [Crepidotus variabilis]|uniref:Nuclear protein 96-domain-containing protein n=1 Tax=Crepidotus variabilis TaxID=179855 RepID=A0A9P6E9Q4_9AGAR|nr:nuclear protein 96-domain-containing protein [Crepidotus variabilis]
MTRFAVYSSDSNTDEEEETIQNVPPPTKLRPQTPSDAEEEVEQDSEEEEESGGSEHEQSGSSELEEDQLPPSHPRRRKSGSRDRNALVADEHGDFRFAHEVDRRVSSLSLSPRTSPGVKQPPRNRGDTTVIPWAHHVGVDVQKMHVMQASLFRTPEEAAALRALNEQGGTKGSTIRLDFDKPQGVGKKHRRDSDGDGLRYDSRERASFGHDIDPPAFRPSRKYARVDIKSSVANGSEGAYFDAGLALGRSFRVGWGPGGQLVHLGSLCIPTSPLNTTSNSSIITLTKSLPSLVHQRPEPPNPQLLSPASLAAKLLQHHLSHTTISRDESGTPIAKPNSSQDTPNPLNFASFVSLFPATDPSGAAPVFRLGSALYDPIDVHLGRSKTATTSPDLRNRITALCRKTALSKWLEDVVKSTVDGDLRVEANNSNVKYTAADAAFTYLTGHQIAEACSKAADGGYLKLATLISQAGGDELYRKDLLSQLDVWKADKLNPGSNSMLGNTQSGQVGRAVWRIYTVLAGLLDQVDDKSRPEADVCAGLDWKRVFGLCLWYGTGVDSSIADVVTQYESILLRNSRGPSLKEVAHPIPRWAVQDSKKGLVAPVPAPSNLGSLLPSPSTPASSEALPDDPLYALIKLYANPTLSLSKALDPLSFSRSAVDVGVAMCWHLYIILSRVMRVRDFADRTNAIAPASRPKSSNKPRSSLANQNGAAVRYRSESSSLGDDDDDEKRVDGLSSTANLLASSYAFQLESWGLLQEAAFVLLHLEDSAGRMKAIKDLLARSASRLDEWMVHGLAGSLKLPMTWIDEAKAMYEFDCGNVYTAYELYISAQSYNAAHQIAVQELAPDAVIRKDFELLQSLFAPLDMSGRRDKIEGWFVRGQIFLDYVKIVTQLPQLLDNVAVDVEQEVEPDASQAEEIEELTKRVPKIIAVLPDVFHRPRLVDKRHPAALEDMTRDLLKLVERARPLTLLTMQQSTSTILDGASKIDLIKVIGYARFIESIEA